MKIHINPFQSNVPVLLYRAAALPLRRLQAGGGGGDGRPCRRPGAPVHV